METSNQPTGKAPNQHNGKSNAECVVFRSADGLVEILVKGHGQARRFPDHDYKVVCIRLRPDKGSRVLPLEDGSGGVECLLTHVEVAQHLYALNQADPKSNYTWRHLPEKPTARKERWRRINCARRGNGN